MSREELATCFYVDLLGTAQPREFDLSLEAVRLPLVDLSGLEAHFTDEEIWDAMRAMPANKSPGLDGFSWEFYRSCWSMVKNDVIAALRTV
jgi:hypothetical protein